MAPYFRSFLPAFVAVVLAAGLTPEQARAQNGSARQAYDTGEIDGDLAGLPAAPQGMKYDFAAVEAYKQQMQAYRQKLASDQAAQNVRAEIFRQQQAAYERELAAVQAARRQYEADRAAYEAELARRRQWARD